MKNARVLVEQIDTYPVIARLLFRASNATAPSHLPISALSLICST